MMQSILRCDNCRRSDFAPFLLLSQGPVESAAERLWLQCLHCHDMIVMAVDSDVQSQLVDLVEDDGEEIRSSDG
jgi:hypothetical protein